MEFRPDPRAHYLHSRKFWMFRFRRNARPDSLYVSPHLPQAMRWLVLLAIKSYWRLTNPSRRRPCLFRETCSRHVYRITRDCGVSKGMMALGLRLRQCRLGYAIEFNGQDEPFLRLKDGSVVRTAELSESMAALVERSRLAVFQIDLSSGRIELSGGPR
jgi:putative component of membrane protein insertase Oxa1/YidC/SpoIIIJ protein YidD